MKRGTFFVLVFLGAVLVAAEQGFSQTVPIVNFRNRGAQYQIGDENEVLIQVNIWGFVRMPGQYLVPSDTDLISLISFAGGPTEDADITKVKLVRTIHLGSDGADEKKKIYEFNVKKFLETGDKSLNPQLMPNDTVIIKGSTVHLISRMLEFASKLTFIAQIYFWISVAKRY